MKGSALAWTCVVLFASSAITVLPLALPAAAQSGTTVAGSLQVNLGTIPNATLPLDNSLMHVIAVTNTGSQNLTLAVQAFNSQNQGVPTYPQPGVFTVEPSEQRDISVLIDQGSGLFPEITPAPGTQLAPGNYTVPIKWVIENQNDQTDVKSFTVNYPIRVIDPTKSYCEMHVDGKVTDSAGAPVPNMNVGLSSQGTAFYSAGTGADGSFAFCVPRYSGWVITTPSNAAGTAYQPRYVFATPGVSNYDIVVQPAATVATGAFQLVKQVSTHAGFWMGQASGNGSLVLMAQGMEIWPANADKNASDLLLYRTDGTLVWNYSMGWQSWATSLSPDAKYAAYATLQDTGNNVPKVGLLDGATGRPIWVQTLTGSAFPVSSATLQTGHTCRAIQISSDDRYVALGCSEGMFYLLSLSTGQVLWYGYMVGQVRNVKFSPDNQYVYVGTDPFLFKFDVATHALLWKADIGAWPLSDGMALSADGSLIATMAKNGLATLVRTSDGSVIWSHDTGGIGQFASISPDGSKVAADSFGGFWVYDAKTGTPLWRVPGSKDGRFSSDGSYVVGPTDSVLTSDGSTVQNLITNMGGSSPGWYQFVYIDPAETRIVASVACCGGYQMTGVYFYSGSISASHPGGSTTTTSATGSSTNTGAGTPTVTVTPTSGPSGTLVTISGTGLTPAHTYAYCFLAGAPPRPPSPLTPCPSGSATFTAQPDGRTPSPSPTLTAQGSPGQYTVELSDPASQLVIPYSFTITSATTTESTATTATGSTQSASSTGGGGIPELPYQPLAAAAVVAIVAVAYLATRRRAPYRR